MSPTVAFVQEYPGSQTPPGVSLDFWSATGGELCAQGHPGLSETEQLLLHFLTAENIQLLSRE